MNTEEQYTALKRLTLQLLDDIHVNMNDGSYVNVKFLISSITKLQRILDQDGGQRWTR